MVEDTRKGNKTLSLGPRLPYPINIVKVYKNKGDKIRKQEPIFQYSTKTWVWEGDNITGEYHRKETTVYLEWPAPSDGKLVECHLQPGEEVTSDRGCVTVEEACTHEIQFHGLCAMCGQDMTEVTWASDCLDTERAPINMTHDQTGFLVSHKAAAKAELELQRRLLDQRKLSLVVDLDQTIIHACIEPTIGDWQRDPSNPNHEAVKDVRSFQLNDDGPRGLASGCWYYIKMRPGLIDFLTRIAEAYELHVYTMGTRAYAMNIAKIVDPNQKLFANRVISRDENGNMTAKSLQRIFPVSTRMVVIIDDRADVWPLNRLNLIKVVPYDFFKGIGDINSSFLPKREDLLPSSSTLSLPAPGSGAASDDKAGAGPLVNGNKKPHQQIKKHGSKGTETEELGSMGDGDDAALIKKQTEEQEKTLEMQIKDRPLLHLQEQLDKEDEQAAAGQEAAAAAAVTDDPTAAASTAVAPIVPQQRHHLLLDDDRELMYLEQHLLMLHEAFYHAYDAKVATHRAEKLRNAKMNTAFSEADAQAAADKMFAEDPPDPPDAGVVLEALKCTVLAGTRIVLSGLVPVGIDVELSEIGLQAKSFGAQILKKVSKQVTHLVISSGRPRTLKVSQAEKIPSIKIVNHDWLIDCLSQWKHLDEKPYIMGSRAQGASGLAAASAASLTAQPTAENNTDAETLTDGETDAAGEGDSSGVAAPKKRKRKVKKLKIVISTPSGVDNEEDEDSDDEDDGGDMDDDDDDDDFISNGALSPIDDLKTFDWGEADAEMEEFLAEDDDDEDGDDDGDDDGESNVSGVDRGGDDDGGNTSNNSEADDNSSPTATKLLSGRKRKLGRSGGSSGGSGTESEDDARLSERSGSGGVSKKQRVGTIRSGSRLRVVRTPEDVAVEDVSKRTNGASLPTPLGTGDEEDVLRLKNGTGTGAPSGSSLLSAPVAAAAGAGAGEPSGTDIDEEELEADLMAELEAEELEEAEKEKG